MHPSRLIPRPWIAVVVAIIVATLMSSCGGSSATDNPDPATPPAESEQNILFADVTPVPTPTPVLVPAEFVLPESCEAMAAFAEEQAAIISDASPTTQTAVDAKAAFNAVVAEQMLQGCI